ncbi:MAG: hypothetical protein DRQ49_02830 [Gammaproteobacteria bacterium]|nr:MAG: hypothetical protein DRQ41_08785 [Gammaproteobacteria bacterium]RKZ42143.1 MAG: hypothetical protein DRQ49_02830 [Gammaproteobacteria bacterium]RKZ76072.1 MAG: hypothetical protein DRQ57_05110 [Gammaproteobacteria bacterium]
MPSYQILIDSQKTNNSKVSVTLLQALLSVLIEGSKGAIRLRAEGRSAVRGAPPEWIKTATQFSMELQENRLHIESPTLYDTVPELFQPNDGFPELISERTSLDYLIDSLTSALTNERLDPLYDKALLEVFLGFRHVMNQGAEKIHFVNGHDLEITQESVVNFKERLADIPSPCPVKVVGKMDTIRSYDQTFRLITARSERVVKGIAKHFAPKEVQALLNQTVLVSGMAHFSSDGKTLRVEAKDISIAQEGEEISWGDLPIPYFDNSPDKYQESQESIDEDTHDNISGNQW